MKNFEKWHNLEVFEDPVCRRCPFLPTRMGFCLIRHMAKDPDHCPTFKFNWVQIMQETVPKFQSLFGNRNNHHSKSSALPIIKYTKHGRINLINSLLSKSKVFDITTARAKIAFNDYRGLKFTRTIYPNIVVKDELHEGKKYKIIYSNEKRIMKLNEVGYDIWNLLDGKRSIEDIIDILCNKYSLSITDRFRIAFDVCDFINQLGQLQKIIIHNRQQIVISNPPRITKKSNMPDEFYKA